VNVAGMSPSQPTWGSGEPSSFHNYFIRPLVTVVRVNGRSYKMIVMFLSFFRHAFSEFPRPIALKRCHMVGIWPNFIMQVQQNPGTKTCKISVDFGPLQTLIANIPGTAEDIQNRPTFQTMAIPPAFDEKVR